MKIPPRHRVLNFGILAYELYLVTSMLLILPILIILTVLSFNASFLWQLLGVIYLIYIYYDHTTRHSDINGNGLLCLRSNFIWRNLRDYFPIELVKTAELPANRNYIVASFPHGAIGTGITNNMGNDIGKWLKLFPGIRPKIATLDMHFYVPILRDMLRYWGSVSVSKKSLHHYLTRPNDATHPANKDGYTSNAVAILVGGVEEALYSDPGKYHIVIKSRKGFVKLAIETGSSIVPSFSFGEVDIFKQIDATSAPWLRNLQFLVKKCTGLALMNFIFPSRTRVVQVVGAPIDVTQSAVPSPAYVDEIHGKVIDGIKDIFDAHKTKYIPNAQSVELVLH